MIRATLSRAKPSWQERIYDWVQTLVPAFMSNYRCKDGRLLYVFAIDHVRLAIRLLEVLGLKDQLLARGLVLEDAYHQSHPGRNLADSSNLSRKWQRELKKALSTKLCQRSALEWEAELNAAGIPCAVQRTTGEWLGLESALKAKISVDIDDPRFGPMRQLGLQAWVERSPKELANPGPAHRIDQDREEILALTNQQRSDVSAPVMRPERTPSLKGLKVLDLCSMIAGPVCTRTLAEYGAEVIKIVSPRPLHGPRMTCWYGIDVDQGKRNLLLDLKTEAGMSVFFNLVKSSDVLVHNLSDDAEKRLDLGYESLKQINPRLICCSVGAFDGPVDGPWAARKGYDPVAQAATGIMMRYGSPEKPEHHAIASCVDYLTGYSAAYAVALGVLSRSRDPSGQGNAVKSSLAQSAQLIQAPFAFSLAGREWTEPHGQRALGEHPLHRIYCAKDGWLFLGARPEKTRILLQSLGLEDSTDHSESEDAMTAALERAFRRRPVIEWTRLLKMHDISVVPIQSLREMRDRIVEDRPKTEFVTEGPTIRVVRQDHPVDCPVDTVAPAYARLLRSPIRYLPPAPKPGAHTLEILNELGYTDSQREDLLKKGIVSLSLSARYLPD
jgi:crotonobetainyl-CoA:carnitine CoA-transferase CaiB-like acyl-CoA transferase